MRQISTRTAPVCDDAPEFMSPERWLGHLFGSQAARNGSVVRRSARDVERVVGWDRFRDELARRGFRAVLNRGQVVVFCNREPVVPLE